MKERYRICDIIVRFTAILVGWDTSIDGQDEGRLFRGRGNGWELIALVRLLWSIIRRLEASIGLTASSSTAPHPDLMQTIRVTLVSLLVIV